MGNVYKITPDIQLWDKFVAGDDEAFKNIYDAYVQSLYKFGRNFTKDEELLQDCVHDLFLDMYKYRSRLKKTNNIKLYLFISLKHKIFRTIKAEGRYKQLNYENIPFTYSLISEEENEFEIKTRRFELLEKAMCELSSRQREAIYLRYVSELSYEELSKVLEMNYQSARNLIYRGIEKLRESCKNNPLILLFSFFRQNLFKKYKLL
jgi:RNA polymerase sigma factor (sigma-70 family)